MEAYSNLVDRILKNPALERYLCDRPSDCLDLVSRDWQERLENFALYQDFKNQSAVMFRTANLSNNKVFNVQRIRSLDHSIKVRLVAKCYLPRTYADGKKLPKQEQSFAVMLHDSAPLNMIAKAMTNDVDSRYQLDDTTKMFLSTCNPLSCHPCNVTTQKFHALGYRNTGKNQPCILNTKVFDGNSVVNRFGNQIKDMFQTNFIVIVDLVINCRYYFENKTAEDKTKKVRIGGEVGKLLAMRESMLNSTDEVNLGHVNHEDLVVSEVPPPSTATIIGACAFLDDESDELEDTCTLEGSQKRSLEEDDTIEAIPVKYGRTDSLDESINVVENTELFLE